jgi:hypothetical protein
MVRAREHKRFDVPALLRKCFSETAFHIRSDQRGKVHDNPQEGRTNEDPQLDGNVKGVMPVSRANRSDYWDLSLILEYRVP